MVQENLMDLLCTPPTVPEAGDPVVTMTPNSPLAGFPTWGQERPGSGGQARDPPRGRDEEKARWEGWVGGGTARSPPSPSRIPAGLRKSDTWIEDLSQSHPSPRTSQSPFSPPTTALPQNSWGGLSVLFKCSSFLAFFWATHMPPRAVWCPLVL